MNTLSHTVSSKTAMTSPTVSLPVLDSGADTLTRHFHAEFMHAFHAQRGMDEERRIYSAIETTARKTGTAPDVVAKTLVDSGLRAGRKSFPHSFITAIENGKPSPSWNIAGLSTHQQELAQAWQKSALAKTHKAATRRAAGPRNIERASHRRTITR